MPTPPINSPDPFSGAFLTFEETARTLKVRVETIRRWLRDGTLHGRKLGKVWRIPDSELSRLASHDEPLLSANGATGVRATGEGSV